MWWRGGSRSVKHRKVIGDLKTIRGSRSIWQREVNVDLQTRGGSRSVRHEEVNGFDIVKPRLKICTCTGSLNSSLDILTDYVISVAFEL